LSCPIPLLDIEVITLLRTSGEGSSRKASRSSIIISLSEADFIARALT